MHPSDKDARKKYRACEKVTSSSSPLVVVMLVFLNSNFLLHMYNHHLNSLLGC